jgi:hypothetical protein
MANAIKKAVEAGSSCKARYSHSVPVDEQFEGAPAWHGIVDVFDLEGHPKARRCYAWKYKDGKETKFVTVLEIPPVSSALSALKNAFASKARK